MNQALDELNEILIRTRAQVAKVVIGQALPVLPGIG